MQRKTLIFVISLLVILSLAFIPISNNQQIEIPVHEQQPDALVYQEPVNELPQNSDSFSSEKEFIRAVYVETARLLGWQNHSFSSHFHNYINPDTGLEEAEKDTSIIIYIRVRPMDENDDEITPGVYGEDYLEFHGYPAYCGKSFKTWEDQLIWHMDGYHFKISAIIVSMSGGPKPEFMHVSEALYQAYWNVVEGKSGGSDAPAPATPTESPQDDICAGVTCKNNYCKDDGSKYMYDCQCSPADGKCSCRYDTCEFGCDASSGGCVLGEADLCADVSCPDDHCTEDGSEYYFDCYCDGGDCYCSSVDCEAGCAADGCLQGQAGDPQDDICDHVVCPDDYCEEDGQTRIYDCKCDPADGECGCLVEVCESGCNAGTGKCEITMVIPADQDGTDSGGSSGGGGYTPSPTPEGPGLLGVIGGVAAGGGVLAGAGYLGYKAIQAALARQAAKAAAKAAAEAAEPSLSELLARAERSADRASAAIDDALKANAKDARNYREFLGRTTAQNDAWSKTMARRANTIEWAEKGVGWTKKGADMTAELLGNVPGVGTTFKYTYNLTTTAAESIASGDSVGTVALKTTGKAMETVAGDAMFGKVTLLKNLPTRMSMRTIKIATRQVGPHYLAGEGLKNEVTLEAMNTLKAKKSATWFGKVEKGLAKAGKKIDRKFIGKTIRKVLYTK